MRGKLLAMLLASSLVGMGACGVRVFDRWTGSPAARSAVPAPADALWERVPAELTALGLLVEELRVEDRLVQLAWTTRSGDGRQYLSCRTPGPVGSASLRPRVEIVPLEGGSEIVVSTEVRSTIDAACESNGQFERWLIERLQPAVAAAAAAGADARVSPE